MTISLLLSTIQQCISGFSLDQITFTQITKFFNLTIDSPYDPNPLNTIQEKFKIKLFDIFHTEGANYKDYLMLPRFRSLKLSTQQKLRNLFNMIWVEYERKVESERNLNFIKEFKKIVPQFKTLDEVETFHFDLLKAFKTSRLNKQNSQNESKQISFPPSSNMISEIQYKRPHESSFFMMDHQAKYNQNPFPLINNVNNANKIVFPKIQDDPKYTNPIWADEKYVQNSSGFPIHNKMSIPYQNSLFPHNETNRMYHQQKLYSQQNFERVNPASDPYVPESSEHQFEIKLHVATNEEEFQQKINSYLFVQCACQATLRKVSAPYMVCKQCQFHFHHECLMMDENANTDSCPCCKLKEGSNIFVKIHQEAFGKRWCKNMKSQKLSLFLTEREIQRLKSEKMTCEEPSQIEYQLRFLKISRRGKSNKIGQNQQQGGITRRFNNLPLPTNYIQKLQPFNQFEIGLKPTEQDKNDECIYFFGIFLVQKFSQRQLTDQLFSNLNEDNSVDESYIKQFIIPQQEFLSIKMKDPTTQRSIFYPVRGNRCSHPQVFDYLSILEYYKEYGQNLKEKHCSICELQIDNMIVDRFLLQKIRRFDVSGQKQCDFMKYFGDGRVEFVEEQDEMSNSLSEGENEAEGGDDSEGDEPSS